MKPAPFDYFAPTSVEEALEILSEKGYDVKVLAGGQSLIPSMNFRLAQPPALLDLNNIPELAFIRSTSDGGVVIGAMTRDTDVEYDEMVTERFPVIRQAMPHIAHPQIRNRGTFGGAIAHADPTAQLPAITLALGARFHVRNKSNDRWVGCDEFFTGPFSTVLEPDELLMEVEIPPMAAHTGTSYQQMARQAGAQALVGVVALVTLNAQDQVETARITMLSVGETPVLAVNAADSLIGKNLTADVIAAAAEIADTQDSDPSGDIHCSPEYRRHLIRVLVARALNEAGERAKA
jgi:aerobic carbon-monoxide dehydrogenase medium subunit